MQRAIVATLLALAFASPAAAQLPNVQQLLQGLTTGNQGQDQALRDAFERGYQRGRQDEARTQTPDRRSNDRSPRTGRDERDSDYSRDDRGRDDRSRDDRARDDRGPERRPGNSYSR